MVKIYRLPLAESDTRVAIDRLGSNAQYNDVGVIEPLDPITLRDAEGKTRTGKFAGTAGLINPCQVLVNYHEVFGDTNVAPGSVSSHAVNFYIGANSSGSGFANKVSGKAIYAGSYNGEDHADDFAIVNLLMSVRVTKILAITTWQRSTRLR